MSNLDAESAEGVPEQSTDPVWDADKVLAKVGEHRIVLEAAAVKLAPEIPAGLADSDRVPVLERRALHQAQAAYSFASGTALLDAAYGFRKITKAMWEAERKQLQATRARIRTL